MSCWQDCTVATDCKTYTNRSTHYEVEYLVCGCGFLNDDVASMKLFVTCDVAKGANVQMLEVHQILWQYFVELSEKLAFLACVCVCVSC